MNSIFNTYKKFADKIIPVMTNNNFVKTGMLTPNEFVKAGDYLVSNYVNWKWGEIPKNKRLSFLPKNKQMLRMKNSFGKRKIFVETVDSDSWSVFDNVSKTETHTIENYNLSDLEDSDLDDDDDAVLLANDITHKKYDITLTYDNYYRTPRIWFNIYDNNDIPLGYNNICEDLSIEHNKVTITMEQHPFLSVMSVSVHPCKHSDVMKKLIKIDLEHDKEINIEKYFVFFLKFVSCIIPHIDFDFTSST